MIQRQIDCRKFDVNNGVQEPVVDFKDGKLVKGWNLVVPERVLERSWAEVP